MALPEFSMRQLLEAGVHFGHQKHRWNPKMRPYIYGVRNNIHILDLSQTVPLLHQALKEISDIVAQGGRVLFVGTKRQAADAIADAARRSAQYYINARWLGGMLTNWKTISNAIKRLRELTEELEGEGEGLTKKEMLNRTRERDKLERALGGIKDMGGTPDMIFVIDTNKEAIAIKEARKLGIPVCAILDSNSDIDGVDWPVPGNDDASRAINLYCDLVAKAALDGIERQQASAPVDLGAQEETPKEKVILETEKGKEAQPEAKDAKKDAKGDAKDESAKKEVQVEKKPRAKKKVGEGASAKSGDKAAEGKKDKESKKSDSVSDKKPAADAKKTAEKAAEKEPQDDLKTIAGIGAVAAKGLQAQGIETYGGLAELSDADIKRIAEKNSFSEKQLEGWKEKAGKALKK